MSEQADISVLIVAYRSRDTIRRCVAALASQYTQPCEVLILENGSPVEDRIDEAEMPDWVTVIPSEENLGFAGGNNHLARLAKGQWLALLNPDAYPHPGWISALNEATARYPDVRLFGSTQMAADRDGILDGVGDVYHAYGLAYRGGYRLSQDLLPVEGEVFAPCGAALFIHRDLYQSLDGFDESFFCYNEDVDLAFRARLVGEHVIQLRSAVVDHAGYGSSGRRSEFATYYGVRNRLWVFLKNMPGWLLWALAPAHLAVTLVLWAAAARRRQAGVFGRALRDGLNAWPRIMRARARVQNARTVRVRDIINALCWDDRALLSRRPDVRPYDGPVTDRSSDR